MPEIRYFTIVQEREIGVWAKDHLQAAEIGEAAFDNKIYLDEESTLPHITRPIREISLSVREDR